MIAERAADLIRGRPVLGEAAAPLAASRRVRVAIVGAGFGGIGMAIALSATGSTTSRSSSAADEPRRRLAREHLSRARPATCRRTSTRTRSRQRRDWSRRYSPQHEILAYLEEVAREHGVIDRIRGRHRGDRARRSTPTRALDGAHDRRRRGDRVRRPGHRLRPAAAGRAARAARDGRRSAGRPSTRPSGTTTYDLAGKRVAVIGTGASAIQFVPEIAEQAAATSTVYQRSAPWILPKPNRELPRLGAPAVRARSPAPACRAALLCCSSRRSTPVITGRAGAARRAAHAGRALMRSAADATRSCARRRARLPDRLQADPVQLSEWYPRCSATTSSWSPTRCERITPDGVVTADGARARGRRASSTAPASAPTTSSPRWRSRGVDGADLQRGLGAAAPRPTSA